MKSEKEIDEKSSKVNTCERWSVRAKTRGKEGKNWKEFKIKKEEWESYLKLQRIQQF
jgi:hypothetical protein